MAANREVQELARCIREVHTTFYSSISETVENYIEQFAENLFTKKIIGRAVRNSKKYSKITDEFWAGLTWKNNEEEIESHCNNFLDSLAGIGENGKRAAERLKKAWQEEAKTRNLGQGVLLLEGSTKMEDGDVSDECTSNDPVKKEADECSLNNPVKKEASECSSNSPVEKEASECTSNTPVEKEVSECSSKNPVKKEVEFARLIRNKTPMIIELIGDPMKLANELWAKELISDQTKDEILFAKHMTRYESASKLLHEVYQYFRAKNDQKMFETFCEVMKTNCTPGIALLIEEMTSTK